MGQLLFESHRDLRDAGNGVCASVACQRCIAYHTKACAGEFGVSAVGYKQDHQNLVVARILGLLAVSKFKCTAQKPNLL